MKTFKTYLQLLLEFFEPHPPFDRLSLEMIRVELNEQKKIQERELISAIPQEYLYSRIHEIEDEAWQYVVNHHPEITEQDSTANY